ncbi:bifunctional aspartate kinase/homoserine dehydrogenase I [Buchnera aphidicola]|uniref:Bifunctional aspartokinase/homoserine dehydrogenase n=1 Tax=Buchnera aphidicola (Cinara strobi) TaxID=1921549 RepID=A0A3B1E7S7_9GAMM|nr:bifunctional aspartate kinase/homoserine dehydrogenase I [Buchnera aphidicola]VAX76427.1 Bifunctional aspartokinase/homoserine dehydrogenase 1 [Buchnera aphidicola (Cinara strobi)]
MKTLKFGGTSLANAEKFIQVSSIIIKKFKNDQVSIVLSAPATITNKLEKSIKKCIKKIKNPVDELIYIKNFFLKLIKDIHKSYNQYPLETIYKKINKKFHKLHDIFDKIKLLKKCNQNIQAQIISTGEIISVILMKELLKTKGYSITEINPITSIVATNDYLNAIVKIEKSKKIFKKINISKKNIILMPGFIAGNQAGELVLLGRNGSDYSAAVLSVCMNSEVCEIWTDVNGIYTVDPNIILTAKIISEITYREASALSWLGAKVIHPFSIKPLKSNNIPCIIKNTNNPNYPGTIIRNKKIDRSSVVQGITYIKKIVLIKIFGTKNFNINNITYKILQCLSSNNIITYLFNNSIAENTVSFYIKKNFLIITQKKIENTLQLELDKKLLKPIFTLKGFSIISIIGSNIKKYYSSILKKICLIVQSFNTKIFSISQNVPDISLSIVLKDKKIIPIIEKIHNLIIHNIKLINIFLIGVGGVGKELLKIFSNQYYILEKKSIQLNINLIANSKNYILNKNTIDLNTWENRLNQSKKFFNLDKVLTFPKKYGLINPILIDCTASQNISNQYSYILKSGFHIITANKKSNASIFSKYLQVRETAKIYKKKFFYETHVGAGLPIIHNLKNLLDSGDKLIKFQGILSGSMSYIFGQLDHGNTLSESVQKAQKLGFTEPNPKDDLIGTDVARKLLILAREAGYKLELSDIKVEKILPDSFKEIRNKKIFLSKLKKLNNLFFEKVKKAKNEKKVLRFIGTIEKNGACSVTIHAVKKNSPLYHIKNGENIFVFYTKYYNPIPLILRGYGAGNIVTASGIFSDLLRIIL